MRKLVTFERIRRSDGTSEFDDFLDSLPVKDRAKLEAVILKTELNGLEVAKRMQWVKKLKGDIFELRSKQGSNIQRALYFQFTGTEYVITHGFTKKTDRTPETEINRAIAMMKSYLKGDDR
ncbi:MAG: type II toxin-antitoxin system RelE/ParE family toxin [Coriobacteriales bacterium]|jgi:phage-related protein|nr:type II toxin-antitoxin system RelE/ParE family toxin [Coriobacteriales bacterium]